MIFIRLAYRSILSRWLTALLTVLSLGFSICLVLSVEKVRTGARTSFADTISGTDLIVGARSGSLNLLLYTVFRIGNATNNVTWTTYQELANRSEIDWIVPISLGDSHRGFRVLGTTQAYFDHYKYRRGQTLAFQDGHKFNDLFDAVIGADVAKNLNYKQGDSLIIGHGLGSVSFLEHADKPFRVSGILKKTGTPVDRTVHVSLEAIEAIHLDWQNGVPTQGQSLSADQVRRMPLQPKSITAAFVGLKSRIATFQVQRAVNTYASEALSAIIPGVALQELWQLVGTAETALAAVSLLVVFTALLGMTTMILTTLNERRREMAILRSVGASPGTILGLLMVEAATLTLGGIILGVALFYSGTAIMQPYLDNAYGLYLPVQILSTYDLTVLGGVFLAGFCAGLVPALRAYHLSISDGMSIRA